MSEYTPLLLGDTWLVLPSGGEWQRALALERREQGDVGVSA